MIFGLLFLQRFHFKEKDVILQSKVFFNNIDMGIEDKGRYVNDAVGLCLKGTVAIAAHPHFKTMDDDMTFSKETDKTKPGIHRQF